MCYRPQGGPMWTDPCNCRWIGKGSGHAQLSPGLYTTMCVLVYANCDMTGLHSASCLVSEPCPQKSTQTDRHTQIVWSGGVLGVYQLTGG